MTKTEETKEDSSMSVYTKEEIQQEIEKTQKQLEALQTALSKAEEDEVPETIDINENEEYWYVSYAGDIRGTNYTRISSSDVSCVDNHRAFKTRKYVDIFANKSQFIADLLHFKYLYDKDYEPNWDSKDELKYCIYYNNETKKFEWSYRIAYSYIESVYFSTGQLAQRCVDWLNKKYN